MNRRFRLFLCLLVLCVGSASAQFRWGPAVGVNFEKYHFKQDLMKVDMGVGGSAGVMGELMFPGIGFGMDLGLNLETHSSKLHFGDRKIWASEGYGTMTSNIYLLQIPINLRFKYTRLDGFENTLAPFLYGGPVFNINIGHNKVPPLEYSGGSVGMQCALGVELFNRYQISGGYYWDLTYEARTKLLQNFSQRPQGWLVKAVWLF